ncbi:unnamed protein product [Moneuplotes crassus]|uniref:SANT and BTB domain-containing protein n=1 Tax=Euplotes crassus TaxID=5936 RepID=A0AAD1Y9Q2_EUPCR|nr:unnamed protein product [Moneuplotes crassus]
MKYFEKYLKSTDSAEDVDISVHCDVSIFEWLINYINDRDTKLTTHNVIPILISAEFLIIRRLIDECIGFIIENLSAIASGRFDLNCLSQFLSQKLASSVTLEQLSSCKDPRDAIQSKLYYYKLDELLKIHSNNILKCVHCNILYTEEQSKWMTCPKAGIFIDYRGRVISNHFPDSNWKIEEFFNFLKKNNVSWRRTFWKIWGRIHSDECTQCNQKFTYADKDHCTYHPEKPIFTYGSNIGEYPCCNAEAVRFSTGVNVGGCENRTHVFKNLKEGSLKHSFLEKHFEILKETVTPLTICEDKESEKLPTTACSNEELKIEDSKSLNVVKHKSMSLLTLVQEFMSTKGLKFKDENCLECLKIGSCCARCYNQEDEENDSIDFNFVLPKKLKPPYQNNNTKKEGDQQGKNISNTATAGKYKLWKMDYFREKDKETMCDITKQLKKSRKKDRSSPMKLLGKSTSRTTPKTIPKSMAKPVSKSGSKPTYKTNNKFCTKQK